MRSPGRGYGGGMPRSFTSSVLAPYERGVEFGANQRAQVARTVTAYRSLFRAMATGPFHVPTWGRRAWQAICDQAPWAAEEIRGIADGAGLPVHEIAALNARTELLAVANPAGAPECSAVVALPTGRTPVACQTWDWYQAMSECWLKWTVPLPDGREITTLTEYGVLAKIGVSSAGVGVLFNKLLHASDASGDIGYPLHLLSRRILQTAENTDDAVGLAAQASASASSAVTVVDAAGAVASLELFPGGLGVAQPADALLVRTNHFLAADGREGCLATTVGPGSEIRRDTLLSAFADDPPASAEQVLEAMHDHAEVGGVCAHPDPAVEPVLRHATLATAIVDVGERSLGVTAGGPCARDAGRITLSART